MAGKKPKAETSSSASRVDESAPEFEQSVEETPLAERLVVEPAPSLAEQMAEAVLAGGAGRLDDAVAAGVQAAAVGGARADVVAAVGQELFPETVHRPTFDALLVGAQRGQRASVRLIATYPQPQVIGGVACQHDVRAYNLRDILDISSGHLRALSYDERVEVFILEEA